MRQRGGEGYRALYAGRHHDFGVILGRLIRIEEIYGWGGKTGNALAHFSTRSY